MIEEPQKVECFRVPEDGAIECQEAGTCESLNNTFYKELMF